MLRVDRQIKGGRQMFQSIIGNTSSQTKNLVEKGAVKKFAEAIGDMDPLYSDEEVGKRSIYQQNIAPPTFPVTFEYARIEGLDLPTKGLIHGEQSFHYRRPLVVGDVVYCSAKVADYYERAGKMGTMGFLVIHRSGKDQDQELIYEEKQVIIISEQVRKELVQ